MGGVILGEGLWGAICIGDFEGEAGNLNCRGAFSLRAYGWSGLAGPPVNLSCQGKGQVANIIMAYVSRETKAMLKVNTTYWCIDPVYRDTTCNLSTLGCIESGMAT